MVKTFTSNDVVRYFYGEISKDEKNEIEEAIAFDNGFQEVYVELIENDKLMNCDLKPKSSTIDSILNYSKSFASVH